MAISINNTVASIVVRQLLGNTGSALSQNYQRLASGLRVNSAADGGSDLAIATRLTSQIGGLGVAKRNASAGLSVAQVADAALVETTNALQKIRDLTVGASTGTASASDVAAANAEIKVLVSEIARIATQTAASGRTLLNGDYTTNIQVGPNAGDTMTMAFGGANVEQLGVPTEGFTLDGTTATTDFALQATDNAISSVATLRAKIGGAQSRLTSASTLADSFAAAFTSARSSIMDADIAAETAGKVRNEIVRNIGAAVFAQANQQAQTMFKLMGLG